MKRHFSIRTLLVACSLWLGSTSAQAAPGDTQLVSISENAPLTVGVPDGPSTSPVVSADGRYVAFASAAANFVDDDANGLQDVFVHDRATGATIRASVSSDGAGGNGPSGEGGWITISADGRWVAFASRATNLVSGGLNGESQILLHDTETRTTTVVSGTPVDDPYERAWAPSISGDGRYVAFASSSPYLVPGDTNDITDIFVRDTHTGAISRVSVSSSGEQAVPGPLSWGRDSDSPAMSSDSRYVAFTSGSTNLVAGDTNQREDVFLHDRQLGTTTRVSVSSTGIEPNAESYVPAVSADGRYVTFVSDASNLVPDDQNSERDLFVHDRSTGTTTRVVTPEPSPWRPSISADGHYVAYTVGDSVYLQHRETDQSTRVSVSSSGEPGNAASSGSSLSADAGVVVFQSLASNFVELETPDTSDVFVRNPGEETTTRIEPEPYLLWGGNAGSRTRAGGALSRDGRYAVFSSAASTLISGDDNHHEDVFLRDLQSGETARLSVGIDGNETDGDSGAAVISAEGRFVAFHSDATNLVAGDVNGWRDVFVHDRQTGTTARVSVGPGGEPFDGNTGWPGLSADGRYVVFERLEPRWPFGRAGGVFLHDRWTGTTEELGTQLHDEAPTFPSISDDGHHIVYVTRHFDLSSVYHYDRERRSTDTILQTFFGGSGTISPDGRFVVLVTQAGLDEHGLTASDQVYLHDLETGNFTLVSMDNGGNPGNGDSRGVTLSADSRYVSFTSTATNLVSNDTNGTTDVFVHDRRSGATGRVSVTGTGAQAEVESRTGEPFEPAPGSYEATISGDGTKVVFTSDANNLVLPTMPDLNGHPDVFLHEIGVLPAVPPYAQDDQGLVVMEAEHFYISLPAQSHWRPLEPGDHLEPWTVISHAEASSGEAIQADPFWRRTAGKPESPVSGYSIAFERAGPHYVWLRGRAASATSDRLGINLDWGPPLDHFVQPDTGHWVWNRTWSLIDVPSPGVHQLWLYRREGGVEIDKIVVTADESFTPAGLGPDESARVDSNASPVLEPIGDQQMVAGETLTLTLAASDPDDDPLTFTAPDLPPFATLTDGGDGTASLTFTPAMEDAGTHRIRVFVSDDGSPPVSDEETFQLQVVASAFRQGEGGTLTMEAEHFDEALPGHQVGPWSVTADPSASRGELVRAAGRWAPSPIDAQPPANEYRAHFNRSGRHYVWIRGRATAPQSDAFYLSLDDGPVIDRYVEPDDGHWVWRREWRHVDVDAPGLHTLRIYRRERNVEIDKIVVTPWPGYQPSGIGPGESVRR